jgi:RND superfamily putative drug exporter
MFVLLFGLSMDYHVFILSRIAEFRRRRPAGTAGARAAVVDGITTSAGVVTSAAAIMVAVFSIFATLSEIEFKVFGVAMAAAVLIDATVVRGVLLPAGLALLGDRAWALPGRKGRLSSASPPPGAPEVPGVPGAPEVNVSVRTGSDKDW